MDVRPIKTKEDYAWGLTQIVEMWGPEIGSPDGDRLEVLMVLLEAYERKRHQIPLPDLIAAVDYYMESQGLPPESRFEPRQWR